MRLFDVVPKNFFSVLSSSNRELYYDALMILYDLFNNELNILLDDYLSSLTSILEDRAFDLEEGDVQTEEYLTAGSKARIILNRLINTGWIDKEYKDSSFIEIVTPKNYTIPVLKLLSELGDNSLQEYNSLVFATYSALRIAMDEGDSATYEALLAAKENTEQLQYSLRSLYHSIRGFLKGIVEQNDVNSLLDDHFSEYKRLTDQIYHPIKTLDSIHRYMGPIQTLLSRLSTDDQLQTTVRERAVKIKKFEQEEQAQNEIDTTIDYIQESYQSLGSLISEIDRKHSTYTKSSIEKIQYLMTADQSIKGKLAELLKLYAKVSPPERDSLTAIMENHINVDRQAFLSANSLYHRNIKSKRTDKAPMSINDEPIMGPEYAYLLEQLGNTFTLAKIQAFVESLFSEDKKTVETSDISLTSDSEFIMLILAAIRKDEKAMPYTVKINKGRTYSNGYLIPMMTITKKEN